MKHKTSKCSICQENLQKIIEGSIALISHIKELEKKIQ